MGSGGKGAGETRHSALEAMKIHITEPQDYSKNALATYASLGEVSFGENPHPETEILTVRLKHKIDKNWMDKMPNLKIIASPTTGLNHIDVAEAAKRGVKLVTLRGHTSFLDKITSTAEETLGLMLAVARRIPQAHEHVKSGGWNRDQFKGYQLAGQTLGILGLGRLGKIVARYGQALGMKVMACDPAVSEEEMNKLGVKKADHDSLFRESDFLSIQVLLTDATQNLVKE